MIQDKSHESSYAVYTLPNCEKCEEIKNFMKEKKIAYEEINVGSMEGMKKLVGLYINNKDKIVLDEKGAIVLPILVKSYSGYTKIIQDVKEMKKEIGSLLSLL